MIALVAMLASLPNTHLPACGGYILHPTPAAISADAAQIGARLHKPVHRSDIGTVMGVGPWRIIWASPHASEPGVFLFRGKRLLDIWGGVPDSQRDGAKWASKLGAPAALANCFGARLYEEGP